MLFSIVTPLKLLEFFNYQVLSGDVTRRHEVFFRKLQFVKSAVDSTTVEQLLVCPHLDNPAGIHNHYPISAADRRESMSNDDRRPPRHQVIESRLNQSLTLGIERARRLVKNQYWRILQQGPRNRQPLPLSA
jgi:hypothetical protein